MNSEGYDAFEDPYCYPGTSVLRNRLDIRYQSELDAIRRSKSPPSARKSLCPKVPLTRHTTATFTIIYFRTFTPGPGNTAPYGYRRAATHSAIQNTSPPRWNAFFRNCSVPKLSHS